MTRVPINRVNQAVVYFKDPNPLPPLEDPMASDIGLPHFHLVSTSNLSLPLGPSLVFFISYAILSARNILLLLPFTPSSLGATEALLS